MKEIQLTITIDELNLILEGLGNIPFAKVYAVVSKIQEQSSQQLGGGDLRGELTAGPSIAPQVPEPSDE